MDVKNIERMRGFMKKYILLSLLLLIAGVFLCINMRTLRLAKMMEAYNCRAFFKFNKSDYYDKLPDNKLDRKIVEAYFSLPGGYKTLTDMLEGEYVWHAAYAWQLLYGLARDEKTDKELTEILDKLRKLDPDNGCPDYIESVINYEKAVKSELDNNKFEKKLVDRQSLEKAVSFYMQAISKPYVKLYLADGIEHIVSLLDLRNDMLGTFQRITVHAMMLFPHLTPVREIGRMVVFYAELLDKEGKKAESRKMLRSGRDMVMHWAKDNTDILIEYLVCESVIRSFYESAQKLNDKEMIEFYGKIEDDFQRWKNQNDKTAPLAYRYGGYLSAMLLPVLRTEIPVETFAPERRLTYLAYDHLALTGFALLCVLIVAYLAAVAVIGKICRKDLVLMKFSLRSWFNIVGLGMLLPIVIYLVFSRVDAIGGRNLSVYANKIGFFGGLALLVFMWLWLEVTVRIEIKKTGKINFVSNSFNRILPYAILLLFVGVILGTWFNIEEKYYCQRDTLFHPGKGFSHIEHKVAQERAGKMVKLLKEQ